MTQSRKGIKNMSIGMGLLLIITFSNMFAGLAELKIGEKAMNEYLRCLW